jgi:hypothetical protein
MPGLCDGSGSRLVGLYRLGTVRATDSSHSSGIQRLRLGQTVPTARRLAGVRVTVTRKSVRAAVTAVKEVQVPVPTARCLHLGSGPCPDLTLLTGPPGPEPPGRAPPPWPGPRSPDVA